MIEKFLTVFSLICIYNLQAQRNDNYRFEAYSALIDKIECSIHTSTYIDDYYYNIQPHGIIGRIDKPDSLVFSDSFRERIKGNHRFENIYFDRILNLEFSKAKAKEHIILHPNSKISILYLSSPINDLGYYKCLFTNDDFTIYIPVISLQGNLELMDITSTIYCVTKKKNKFKVKKISSNSSVWW